MEDHNHNQQQNSLTKTTNNDINNNVPPLSPHVVIFPLPIQGPINSMLKLADLLLALSQSTIFITFVTTDYIHRRLALYSSAAARLAQAGPQFRFETVPDMIGPDEDPRVSRHVVDLAIFLEDQAKAEGSRLREVLAYGAVESKVKKRVTCIIADGLYGCMVDVAGELKVPLVYFETISPCGLWTYLSIPNMLHLGDLPFQGKEEDLDTTVTSVPGMETYLRRRDLPSFCRAYDPNSRRIKLILNEVRNWSRAQGHILNTFDELEGDYFRHIQAMCPNLYNIGPIHLNLKYRVTQENANSLSNSMWQEDHGCLAWLNAQPPGSVLFVSIGSLAVMTWDQFMEFWHGLVNSKTRFLWVRRPYSIVDLSDEEAEWRFAKVPQEVLEGTSERGCIVSWAPQEVVLAHEAIGGFLTHSGWNSTLESIVEGVPMICWPYIVDQLVNSRLVSEVWKNGLDMKDTCDRVVIEKLIKDLMEIKRDKLLARANELAKLAAEAVAKGGSAYNSLNRLIDDIKFMRFQTPICE